MTPSPTPRSACRHTQAGFTLVELSITMLLMTLLVGMLFSVYTFLNRQFTLWQERVHLQSQVHVLMQRISRDLQAATLVEPDSVQAWTIAFGEAPTVRYVYVDSVLQRNGRGMHAEELRVISFGITRMAPSLPMVVADSNAWPLRYDVSLQLAGTHAAYALNTSVTSRSWSSWPPLARLSAAEE